MRQFRFGKIRADITCLRFFVARFSVRLFGEETWQMPWQPWCHCSFKDLDKCDSNLKSCSVDQEWSTSPPSECEAFTSMQPGLVVVVVGGGGGGVGVGVGVVGVGVVAVVVVVVVVVVVLYIYFFPKSLRSTRFVVSCGDRNGS